MVKSKRMLGVRKDQRSATKFVHVHSGAIGDRAERCLDAIVNEQQQAFFLVAMLADMANANPTE